MFAIKEIIYGAAYDFNDNILYVLDQLSSASIEISSDPVEITDKNGNVIRQVFNSKTGTFTATSALISPVLLNAQSGSKLQTATADAAINMPKIVKAVPETGKTVSVDVADATDMEAIQIIGMYGNGANGDVVPVNTMLNASSKKIVIPAKTEASPDYYLISYSRDVEDGLAIENRVDAMPDTIRLLLFCAIMDPCENAYRAGYVKLWSVQPDPSTTISLSADSTETDFNATIQTDYCGSEKLMYTIYFPGEETVNQFVNGAAQ